MPNYNRKCTQNAHPGGHVLKWKWYIKKRLVTFKFMNKSMWLKSCNSNRIVRQKSKWMIIPLTPFCQRGAFFILVWPIIETQLCWLVYALKDSHCETLKTKLNKFSFRYYRFWRPESSGSDCFGSSIWRWGW